MAVKGLGRRFDRSQIAPSKAERDGKALLQKRQAGTPPASTPGPTTPGPPARPESRPSGPPPGVGTQPPGPPSQPPAPGNTIIPGIDPGNINGRDEDDTEAESEDEDSSTTNPFEPETSANSQPPQSVEPQQSTVPLQSIDATTTESNPFVGSSTPGAFFTSTFTVAQISLPTGSSSTTPPPLLFPITTSTSTVFSSSSSSISVGPVSSNTSANATIDIPEASSHPLAKAAIIVPAVVGSVIAMAAIYLLFRYCAPIQARWVVFRARRGHRLPEEETGVAPTTTAMYGDAYATNTAQTSREPFSGPSAPSTPMTLAPSFVQGTALALPVTSTRAPPPMLVRNLSKSTAQGAPPLPRVARGDSNTTNYGPSAFNFNIAEHGARTPGGHNRHPSGLDNNPLNFPMPQPPPKGRGNFSHGPYDAGVASGAGLGVTFPRPPTTPMLAHFGSKSPPESVIGDSSRLRKSITPSESISNVPESPYRLTHELAPPVPALDSRWSYNSSSIHGRMLAEAMSFGPSQSTDMGRDAQGRPLSRFPSLQSSSTPVRGGSR